MVCTVYTYNLVYNRLQSLVILLLTDGNIFWQVMGASPGTGLFVRWPRDSFFRSLFRGNHGKTHGFSSSQCFYFRAAKNDKKCRVKVWIWINSHKEYQCEWERNVRFKAILTPGLQGFDPSAYVKLLWEEHEWDCIIQPPLRFCVGKPWLENMSPQQWFGHEMLYYRWQICTNIIKHVRNGELK